MFEDLFSWFVPSRLYVAHGTGRCGRAEDDRKGEGRKRTGKSCFQNGGPINGGKQAVSSGIFSGKNLRCPYVYCTTHLGGAFYEETVLVQHYRANTQRIVLMFNTMKNWAASVVTIQSQAQRENYATRRMAVHLSLGKVCQVYYCRCY